jgi:parvulin-like peptidyl-prolyl isomerase
MKKATKSAAKTTKQASKSAPASKAAKTVKPTKRTAPEKSVAARPVSRKNYSQDIPMWVKVVAIVLIILGYAVYRFWGIAKVGSTTISRLEYYQAMERQVGEQTVQKLIEETLILQEAARQNFTPDQRLIDEQIATVSAQIVAQGSTVEEVLEAEGLTMEDVRRMYEIDQIVQKLGRGDVQVSEQEIDEYIAQNQDNIPDTLSEEEVRNMVRTQLENQKASQNAATWIQELKDKAEVIRY